MRKLGWSAGLLLVLALVGFAPSAHASNVNFFCSSTDVNLTCTGTVATSGPNFSSTGITVFNTTGPYLSTVPFTLTFNTGTGAISLTNGTDTLTGNITGFTSGPGFAPGLEVVTLNVAWTSLPALVQGQLGSTLGVGVFTGVTFFLDEGTARVSHVLIGPTPEPGTLALFGSGLLMAAGVLRRKIFRG